MKKRIYYPKDKSQYVDVMDMTFGTLDTSDEKMKDLNDAITQSASENALARLPKHPTSGFAGMVRRERIEEWVRHKKVEFGYTAHEHTVTIRIWGTEVIFKEPYEVFPSEWLIAQVALAVAAGAV